MAGTWMSLVKGFGGMRIKNEKAHFSPFVPDNWTSFSFKIRFRGNLLNIKTTSNEVTIENLSGGDTSILLYDEEQVLKENSSVVVKQKDFVLV
jgi:maltose phosphorylase